MFLGAYVALLLGYHSVETELGALVRTAVGGLGFVPLNLCVIYWLHRAARNTALAAEERQGLHWLAVMFGLTLLGNLGYAFDGIVRQRDPTFGWTNIPYLLTYPVGAFGLSRFPNMAREQAEGRNVRLDLAGFVVAAAALVWTFILSPIDLALAPLPLAITLAYPIAAILLLAFVWRLLLVQAVDGSRRDVMWLGTGLFVQCVTDLVLGLDFDNTGSLTSTWSAAVAPWTYVWLTHAAERAALSRPVNAPRAAATLVAGSLPPLVAAVAIYAALFWAAESGPDAPLGPLVIATIAFNIVLLVKQASAAAENGRLMAARAEAESRVRFEKLALEGQKLEAVGRLAGGVAHDFNNLLTTVLANAELALERLRPGEGVHDEVSDIRRAALRGAELVRQLLAYSRKSIVEPVCVSPGTVVRDIERLLQRLAGDQHPLHCELPPELGAVRVDRGRLEQVLANLISNARDAMPTGGVITVRGANVTLDASQAGVLSLTAGRYVAIAVHDTGVGISAEVRGHIFEPFFSTKDVGKGTGLGLASAYGIIRQSLGAIDVQSRPGEGATFTIYLPRVEPPPAPATATTTVGAGQRDPGPDAAADLEERALGPD